MNVVAQMLLTDPKPLVIWAILALMAALAFAGLAKPDALRNLHPALALTGHHDRREHRRQQAAHSVRYADELAVAGQRAAQAADRWHAHWQQTERQAATAWQAWQDAEQRLARLRTAAVFTMPAARTPDEYADRERFLHRTVRAAVDRGDLPSTALADVLAGQGAFNPWLHPVDQELAVHRAIAAHRYEVHRQATAAEQAAWHDARLAVSSRDSLRQEAAAAITEAASVRHLLPLAPASLTTKRRLARVPRIA
ncbi:hypothetical protein ACIA5C_02035 [Actinoplanes sp. NPDC051343]|uniref:hypothetical protein n=1 Tax=Actinoplanes sp. NPDC051343 TaxID=3363906 RepID=UPI0037B81CDA